MTENSKGNFPMAVADPLAPFEKEGMIKLIAPAKANLFLGIGELQEDGFHRVSTVMHAMALHDVLHLDHEEQTGDGLQVEVVTYARGGLEQFSIASEENLAYKAIHALAERLQRNKNEKIKVRIEKYIPQEAGLGGGSSDAAAALVGAAQLWGLDSHSSEVVEIATKLGSDVVFFLYGGCACFEGKGDVFLHNLEPMKKIVVLIKPKLGVSTAAAYRIFDESPEPLSQELSQEAIQVQSASDVPLYNNLTHAAYSVLPELKKVHTWISQQPEAQDYLLCGSGSATFVECGSINEACQLVAKARAQGWWARSTSFSSAAASQVPKR